LEIEPIENTMREHLGEVLSPERLADAPAAIERLLSEPQRFQQQMRQLRETIVFRLGHSIPDGAAEIARLADGQRGVGSAEQRG
jgi:hypothetical protein